MEHISATDAQNNFGALIDTAQLHPIMVCKRKRDYAVIISAEEYTRLREARGKSFIALADKIRKDSEKRGLTPNKAKELLEDI